MGFLYCHTHLNSEVVKFLKAVSSLLEQTHKKSFQSSVILKKEFCQVFHTYCVWTQETLLYLPLLL